MKIAKEKRIDRYVFEESKSENQNAKRMGRPLKEEKTQIVADNIANLKKLDKAELLDMIESPFISYEYYCLVKAEIKRRKRKK